MALDIPGAYAEIIDLLESITGMQKVYQGVPDALGSSITAYCAATSQEIIEDSSGLILVRSTFYTVLGYKVAGAPATAESTLIAGLQDLITKFMAARKTDLNGKVENCSIDMTIAADPQYEIAAAQEYRRYPLVFRTDQTQNV